MATMRSSVAGAGLVAPLPARAAFRPVAKAGRAPVVARASAGGQVQQKVAALGAATTTLLAAGSVHAAEAGAISDSRAALLATLFVPALGWVAFNILEPALNQYKNMRLKGVAGGLGLTAASMLLAEQAQAAQQVSELAAGDNRALILGVVFVPALGWVAFNILEPALNQYKNMRLKGAAAGLGLTAGSMLLAEQAEAAQQVSELAAGDNRALILAVVFLPALGWVAFNILGPALNQLATMAQSNPPAGGNKRRR